MTDFIPVVSLLRNGTDSLPVADLPFPELLARIKNGAYRQDIREIRERFQRALERTGDRDAAKDQVGFLKKRLPGFTASGVFGIRKEKHLKTHSGLIQADLDLLGNRLQEFQLKLANDPHVYALFVSPSGDGLKAFFRIPVATDKAAHTAAFFAVEKHVRHLYGVDIDPAVKDMSRLCYVSDDPGAILNHVALELPLLPPFVVPVEPEQDPVTNEPQPRKIAPGFDPANDEQRVRDALCFIASDDRDTWLKVGFALKAGFNDSTGWALFDLWSQTSPDAYDPDTNRAQWDSFKPAGGISLASLFHLAKQRGFQLPPPPSRRGLTNEYLPSPEEEQAVLAAADSPDNGDSPVTRLPPPLSFLSYDEISALNLAEQSVVLGEQLISSGSLACFLAPGGLGKSRLIQQLACACAAGHSHFLAWPIHPAAHSLRWLIVQAENSARRLRAEADHFRRWIGPDLWPKVESQIRVLTPLKDEDSLLNLDQPDVFARLSQSVRDTDIVVFDALYNFSFRELSKGAEMLAAADKCCRLAKYQNPNRIPIVLHHALTGQSGSQRAAGFDRASYGRDSKILHQRARSVINISAVSEDSNSQLLVTCGKCSDGKEFPPFLIRLHPDRLIYELDSNADVLAAVEIAKSSTRKNERSKCPPDRVRRLTPMAGCPKSDLAKLIVKDCGCPRESAYRLIKSAISSKSISESHDLDSVFRA